VFKGSIDSPTFTPSVKLTWGDKMENCCHYIITDGQVKFCDDCTHDLKGQTVPLPLLPLHDDNVEDNV
jgi:hypothetical protein